MRKIYGLTLLTLTAFLTLLANAQQPDPADFYTSIGKYDLSRLWRADSIVTEGDGEKAAFPEPLGYLGENFQRFDLHYISVVRAKDNPRVYNVIGRTRVNNNICSFRGTITILKAGLDKGTSGPGYDPRYQQGYVICATHFYEDSSQAGSGIIEGRLTTDFYLDKTGKIYYNALMAVADSYCNNQCEATWTSYKTGTVKKCNWGDYRIPDSKGLDIGAGVFYVNEKYIRSGWETYTKAYGPDRTESKEAIAIEETKWWEK